MEGGRGRAGTTMGSSSAGMFMERWARQSTGMLTDTETKTSPEAGFVAECGLHCPRLFLPVHPHVMQAEQKGLVVPTKLKVQERS